MRDDEAPQALADAHTAPVVGQIAEAGLGAGAAVGWSADAPSQDPRANEAGVNWAMMKATNQREAAAWLSQDPFRKLVLQRTAMEPLRQAAAKPLPHGQRPVGKGAPVHGSAGVGTRRKAIGRCENIGHRLPLWSTHGLASSNNSSCYRRSHSRSPSGRCRSVSSPGAQCAMQQVLQVTSWPPWHRRHLV